MKTRTKNIASQRIQKLFNLIEDIRSEVRGQSENYAETARKISMAARIHIPKEYRLWICKGCKKLMWPGRSCHVRIQKRREPHIVITCNLCGKFNRIPIKLKVREKHETTDHQTSDKT